MKECLEIKCQVLREAQMFFDYQEMGLLKKKKRKDRRKREKKEHQEKRA